MSGFKIKTTLTNSVNGIRLRYEVNACYMPGTGKLRNSNRNSSIPEDIKSCLSQKQTVSSKTEKGVAPSDQASTLNAVQYNLQLQPYSFKDAMGWHCTV